MKLTLHHINFASKNLPAMEDFYRSVLDMQPEPELNKSRDRTQGYPGNVAFLSDGDMQMHLAEQDLGVGFRTGQAVNPVHHGHIAFRTDDLEAVKQRLTEKGIAYSDYGTWAMNGWHQIFFYDPDGNVVEVHQVIG